MKFCDKHWQMLRAAIEARGLSHLVATNGAEAMAAATEDLAAAKDGRPSEAAYDPLMACHWMVSGQALEQGGLYLMTGDFCPVCEAIAKTSHLPLNDDPKGLPVGEDWVERHWIDGPADAALGECRRRGLVAAVQ